MKARHFLGNYLTKDDIDPSGQYVTLVNARVDKIGEDEEEKLIVYFKELEKALVMNKTNINTMIDLTGTDETDDWNGFQVVVYNDPTITFGGKRVGGLRIRGVQELKGTTLAGPGLSEQFPPGGGAFVLRNPPVQTGEQPTPEQLEFPTHGSAHDLAPPATTHPDLVDQMAKTPDEIYIQWLELAGQLNANLLKLIRDNLGPITRNMSMEQLQNAVAMARGFLAK